MPLATEITLNNGKKCPVLGLGTWLSSPGQCTQAVKCAIKEGYRLIDAAWLYGNEKEVGKGVREAIEEGLVKREDLFITTKLWNTFHEKDQVVPALKESLKNLGLDYIDLYLIHWPVASQSVKGPIDINLPFKNTVIVDHDFCETWAGMEQCVDLNLTKSIGLSNFNSKQILKILEKARIKPVMNQVEVTPLLNQKKLTAFCKERGIEITAYSPFASPARPWKTTNDPAIDFDDPQLVEIGLKYGKNSAQVILRYLIQLGVIPIPKSENPARIKQNINIFDFELTSEEMKILDSYNKDFRAIGAEDLEKSNDFPFRGVEF
ncbi:aldo-keto reductase family 1 member B1-like [Euwallacea similis]|uniref:aldo-keto reductase family 1 member B1-like n=1 Tax=Euwallacea similis TaxID=1736056 RepID=UPI00344E17EE